MKKMLPEIVGAIVGGAIVVPFMGFGPALFGATTAILIQYVLRRAYG